MNSVKSFLKNSKILAVIERSRKLHNRFCFFQFLFFCMVVLFLSVTLRCGGGGKTGGTEKIVSPSNENQAFKGHGTLPDIVLEKVDGSGLINLRTFAEGKVLIIFFWATWCTSCKPQIITIKSNYDSLLKHGIEVLAVSIDTSETKSEVLSEVSRFGMPFPVVFDTESRASSFLNPTSSAPFTVIVDKNRKTIYSHEGFLSGDFEKIQKIAIDASMQ